MIVDEKMFEKIKKEGEDYSAGVILPDGSYVLAAGSHLHALLTVTKMTESQVWDMIPKEDSALFWLIAYTGCVITDYNSSVGMVMTPAQKRTYRALVSHGIIADKYYDISNERKKTAEALGGREEKHT